MRSNHNSTTCLGIDPGIGRLGYGIVTRSGHYYRVMDYGCVETPPHTDLCLRIKMIYDDIRYRIEKWDPEIISIEKLFFWQKYNHCRKRLAGKGNYPASGRTI